MRLIYMRPPMPKCDFNKVALQLYWNHSSSWVLFAICWELLMKPKRIIIIAILKLKLCGYGVISPKVSRRRNHFFTHNVRFLRFLNGTWHTILFDKYKQPIAITECLHGSSLWPVVLSEYCIIENESLRFCFSRFFIIFTF